MEAPKTPELDKLNEVFDKSQEIGQFIDWLCDEADLHDTGDRASICVESNTKWYPVYLQTEHILAKYFNIDLDKIEKELRELLDYQCFLNEENSNER